MQVCTAFSFLEQSFISDEMVIMNRWEFDHSRADGHEHTHAPREKGRERQRSEREEMTSYGL